MLTEEGEHSDQTDNALTRNYRAKVKKEFDGHLVRRTVTKGEDQILTLDDGELALGSIEYSVLKSVGDYHCICGETFGQDHEAAREHMEANRVE